MTSKNNKAGIRCPVCGGDTERTQVSELEESLRIVGEDEAYLCTNPGCDPRPIYPPPETESTLDSADQCPYCASVHLRSWGRTDGSWTMNQCQDCRRKWETDGGIVSKVVNGLLNPIRAWRADG